MNNAHKCEHTLACLFMCICVHMYVIALCMCTPMECVCLQLCACVHLHPFVHSMYIPVCINMHTCVLCIYACTCVRVYVYVHASVHMCECVPGHAYISLPVHRCMFLVHACMHACICMQRLCWGRGGSRATVTKMEPEMLPGASPRRWFFHLVLVSDSCGGMYLRCWA